MFKAVQLARMKCFMIYFRYAEIYTDLNFIAVPTIPLELRAGTDKVKSQSLPDDGAEAGVLSDIVRKGHD